MSISSTTRQALEQHMVSLGERLERAENEIRLEEEILDKARTYRDILQEQIAAVGVDLGITSAGSKPTHVPFNGCGCA